MSIDKEYISKKKIVYNITPFTLLDYPAKTACIVWLCGCGMRCGYCYNTDIVTGSGNYSYDEVLEFLESRKGLLQGVVLCGGEPLFGYDNAMLSFIVKVKNMGFMVKLDTNGVHTQELKELINLGLIDYVALDFKAPKDKFELVTKNNVKNFDLFIDSLQFLIENQITFEVRTTIHSQLLQIEDVENILDILEKNKYSGIYYLQNFKYVGKSFNCLGRDTFKITSNLSKKDSIKIKIRN